MTAAESATNTSGGSPPSPPAQAVTGRQSVHVPGSGLPCIKYILWAARDSDGLPPMPAHGLRAGHPESTCQRSVALQRSCANILANALTPVRGKGSFCGPTGQEKARAQPPRNTGWGARFPLRSVPFEKMIAGHPYGDELIHFFEWFEKEERG